MSTKYPLHQLELIKKKRLDEAERELAFRKKELAKEEEILRGFVQERDKTKIHKSEKLQLLRESMDKGDPGAKIESQKAYLKIVDADLEKKEKKVTDQKVKVDAAAKAVEQARTILIKRQHDVEKLAEHKKEWQKEQIKEEEHKDEIHADELGVVMHNLRKQQKGRT